MQRRWHAVGPNGLYTHAPTIVPGHTVEQRINAMSKACQAVQPSSVYNNSSYCI